MSQSMKSASWSELLRGRNGLRSIALAGGVALHAVNVYIVATVLPSVVRDIGGLEYYAWNMTLFVVASIIGSTATPKAIDSLGLRNSFLLAILIFCLGTIACAAAPTMGWLLLGRTCQGLGGGFLLGLSYASARILFKEHLWPLAMALLSSMWGVATLAGPAIGGIFSDGGAWRWAFWSVLPIAAMLGILVITQISPQATQRNSKPVRIPGWQLLLMVISALVLSMASLSSDLLWNIVGIIMGIAATIAIGLLDNKSSARLLPKGGYSLKGNLGSLYACMALLSIAITAEIFIPYFLQLIQGLSPLISGYLMVLISAGWSSGSITSSSRSTKAANHLISLGPVISMVSVAGLAIVMPLHMPAHNTILILGISILLFGIGLGIGFSWPHLITHVFRNAPEGQENIASSAIITVQLYALALGSALGGMITNAAGFQNPGGLVGTQSAAFALLSVLALAPALAAFLIRPVVKARN